MDRIQQIILRNQLLDVLLAIAILLPIYIVLREFGKVDGLSAIWTIAWIIAVVLGFYEKRNKIQYWIRTEYRDLALQSLSTQGFELIASDGNRNLYAKQLLVGRRYFAIETDHSSDFTRDVPDKFENALDSRITTDMLSGGKRLVGRRLFRKKPKVQEAGSTQ
jgi:hypothetical protein